MHCSTCGAALPEGAASCPICGHSVTEDGCTHSSEAEAASSYFASVLSGPLAEVPAQAAPTDSPPPRKRSRAWLFLGIGLTAALLIGLLFFLGRTPQNRNPVFWISDYQLLYLPHPGARPIALMDDLSSSVALALSGDKKTTCFFTDEALYKVDLEMLEAGSGSAITEIETGVRSPMDGWWDGSGRTLNKLENWMRFNFFLSDDGRKIYYVTGRYEAQRLRCFDGESSTTLEAGFESASFSEDGSRVLLVKDGLTYLRDVAPDAAPVRLSSEKVSICRFNEDFSELCYLEALPTKARDSNGYEQQNLCFYDRNGTQILAENLVHLIDLEDRAHYAYTVENDDYLYTLYTVNGEVVTQISDQLYYPAANHCNGFFQFEIYDPSSTNADEQTRNACADSSGEVFPLPEGLSSSYLTANGDIYGLTGHPRALAGYSRESGYQRCELMVEDVYMTNYYNNADRLFYTCRSSLGLHDLYTLQEGKPHLLATGYDSDSGFTYYTDGAMLIKREWDGETYNNTYTPAQGREGPTWERVYKFFRDGEQFLNLGDYAHGAGTIYLCEGEKQTVIAENVSDFCYFADDEIASLNF